MPFQHPRAPWGPLGAPEPKQHPEDFAKAQAWTEGVRDDTLRPQHEGYRIGGVVAPDPAISLMLAEDEQCLRGEIWWLQDGRMGTV